MRNAPLLLGTLLAASHASAASFSVTTHDGRATAMATAVTADVDDASAAAYNPAGIAQPGKRFSVRLGDTVIVPTFTFTPAGGPTTRTVTSPMQPPHVFASLGLTEEAAVGISFFQPYGLDVTWPDGWPGQYLALHSALRDDCISPVVAYRFLNRIRVALGLQISRATFELRQDVDVYSALPPFGLAVTTSAWGVGGNAGLQVDILKSDSGLGKLTVGAAYRSPVSFSFRGTARLGNGAPELQDQLHDQPASTDLTLPQTLQLGVAWRFGGLRLDFDAQYHGWENVDAMSLRFNNAILDQTLPMELKSTWNFALGAEYGFEDHLFVRLGVMWDPSPFSSQTLNPVMPDADRLELCGGLGYRHPSGLAIDLGYMAALLRNRSSSLASLPGVYGGSTHVFSLTVGLTL